MEQIKSAEMGCVVCTYICIYVYIYTYTHTYVHPYMSTVSVKGGEKSYGAGGEDGNEAGGTLVQTWCIT